MGDCGWVVPSAIEFFAEIGWHIVPRRGPRTWEMGSIGDTVADTCNVCHVFPDNRRSVDNRSSTILEKQAQLRKTQGCTCGQYSDADNC